MTTILVAEDEQLTRWSVSETLREERFVVDEAQDGQTAIKLVDEKSFDAVITDYAMPGPLTGLDVLKHYHDRSPNSLKVLITAQNGDAKREVEAIGGIYLQKPLFLGDLIAVINRRLTFR
jgi:DNA-binding NtrC family response regulator